MTNGELFENMSLEEKKELKKTYSNHPLVDYINWEAFYNSSDGNTLNFVDYYDKYTNNEGHIIFVLDYLVENDEDYMLVYDCEEGCLMKIPDTTYNEVV